MLSNSLMNEILRRMSQSNPTENSEKKHQFVSSRNSKHKYYFLFFYFLYIHDIVNILIKKRKKNDLPSGILCYISFSS